MQDLTSYFRTEIEEFKKKEKFKQESLESYFTNTEIPLNDRWVTFVAACKSGYFRNVCSYALDFDALNDAIGEVSWYDDYNVERYEIFNLYQVVERSGTPAEIFAKVDIPQLKEEILACGYTAFKFDW